MKQSGSECSPTPGTITLVNVKKVYRRSRQIGRLHSLKGALFHRQLETVKATSQEFVALEGVDLAVAGGEAIAFIGPNGSGKSTALKLISGILQPTIGTVTTTGRVTALIELGAGFHPEITGRENVVINAMLLGMSRPEINSRLEEIIAFAGVGDFIDQPVKTYSSGMYVRLGFAVAVAVDPAVLLIDEVLAVGDAEFSGRSLDRLARMRQQGVTMVLVSHDLELVESFADRVVYLRKGRVIMDGPPAAVISRYQEDLHGVRSRQTEEPANEESAPKERSKRWGSRQVTITSVSVTSGGRTVQVIPSGVECTVTIQYQVAEPVTDFVFGIAWSLPDGTSVAGHNTNLDGWRARSLAGDGEVACTYDSVQLAPGEYLLDVAVHTRDGAPYDYWCEAARVQVTAPVAWPGVWAPNHHWSAEGPSWTPPPGPRSSE